MSTRDQCSLANRRSMWRVHVWLWKTRKNVSSNPASNVTRDFFIWGVTELLKNISYMYKPNGWDWSSVVTHHPQNNFQRRNPKILMTLKSIKKYAMQTQSSSNLLKEEESTRTPAEFCFFSWAGELLDSNPRLLQYNVRHQWATTSRKDRFGLVSSRYHLKQPQPRDMYTCMRSKSKDIKPVREKKLVTTF